MANPDLKEQESSPEEKKEHADDKNKKEDYEDTHIKGLEAQVHRLEEMKNSKQNELMNTGPDAALLKELVNKGINWQLTDEERELGQDLEEKMVVLLSKDSEFVEISTELFTVKIKMLQAKIDRKTNELNEEAKKDPEAKIALSILADITAKAMRWEMLTPDEQKKAEKFEKGLQQIYMQNSAYVAIKDQLDQALHDEKQFQKMISSVK